MADLTGVEVGGVIATFDGNTKPFEQATDRVRKGLSSLSAPFAQMEALGRKAFLGIAAAAGFAIKAYADTEAAQAKLRSAMQVSLQSKAGLDTTDISASVDTATDKLEKFNEAMQLLTVNDKAAYASVEAFALNLGVAGQDIEQVTKVGAGLAERFFGGDLQAGAEAAAKAYNGNFRELQRLLPQLGLLGSAGAKWAYIQQQGNLGMIQAEARTKTFDGSLKQLWNQVNQTAEGFGALLVPQLEKANQFFTNITLALQKLTPEQREQIVHWGEIAAGVAAVVGFGPMLVSAFSGPLKLVGAAFTLLLSPIGLTIAGIAGIATAFAYFEGTGTSATARVSDGFQLMGQDIYNLFSSWQNFSSGMVALWNVVADAIGSVWDSLRGYLITGFQAVNNFLGGSLGTLAGFIGDTFEAVFNTLFTGIKQFANTFASVADVMFGSWQGFVGGIVTLWDQSGFIILDIWTKTKAGLLNIWEDTKEAFKSIFYSFGDVVAEFGVNMVSAMTTIAENVRNIWNEVIDYIASKLARVIAKVQVGSEVSDTAKAGDTLTEGQANTLASLTTSTSAEAGAAQKDLVGKQVSQDDIDALTQKAIEVRVQHELDSEDKGRKLQDQIHAENLNKIRQQNASELDAVKQWSNKGLIGAVDDDKKNVAANNADRDSDLSASKTAAAATLKADLDQLSGLPKISDKTKGLIDQIEKAINLGAFNDLKDKISKLVAGVGAAGDKAKDDADKLVNSQGNVKAGSVSAALDQNKAGQSIEDYFKMNLGRQDAAVAIDAEAKKQQAAKADAEKKAAAEKAHLDAMKKNQVSTDRNTTSINDLNKTLQNGVPALAVA